MHPGNCIQGWGDAAGQLNSMLCAFNLSSNACGARRIRMETSDWPFKDPPNVAVFTVGSVMNKALPILLVCHDKEACEWQFLTGGEFSMKEAMLVTLRSVVAMDATIKELADLP